MSPNDQYQSIKNRLFEKLDCIRTWGDRVKFIKRELKFLDIFLSLQSYTDEPNMPDVVTPKVQALFRGVLVDLSTVHHFDINLSDIMRIQNRIRWAKMEVRAKYYSGFPKISSLPNNDGIHTPKLVAEYIDAVLENIGDLVKGILKQPKAPCSLLCVPGDDIPIPKHMEDVSKELKLLRNFVCFISERFIEPRSQFFFAHALAVAGHASMLAWLYFSGRGFEHQDEALGEINVLLFLLMKCKPVQRSICKNYVAVLRVLKSTTQSGRWCPNIQDHEHAADSEANLLETILHHLLELPASSNSVALEDHLAILQDSLKFLRADIIRVSTQDLNLVLRDIDSVLIDIALQVYSLYEGEDKAPGEVNPTQVLDLLGNIKRMTSTVINLSIRKQVQCNLPRIRGLGYVDFLLSNLEEFQRRHADSLTYVENQLQIIQKELKSLQPFLNAVSKEPHNDLKVAQHCATQLIDKAYEVEYIIYACIHKEAHVCCLQCWLLEIIQEITLISEDVTKIHENKMLGDASMNTVIAHTSSSSTRSPRTNEEIVGFEDVIEKLRHQLINGTKQRVVIPIVGMPGLGKTTLAYRLYFDRLVVSHFKTRAQCCVSQVYARQDLLRAILRDVGVDEDSQDREKCADHELADKLRKTLFTKRYLILIDDVWEASAWDDLLGCFQDANNGSRIIVTTRNHEVAEYVRFQSDPFPLRMFNNDESWELLRKKVFGKERFPPHLNNIGQQIAKKCGQLPLSVALVSGILAEMDKKEECWKQLANNLGPHIHKDSRAIIEQSYQMLPYHLRSCFLYFGSFLEDRVIDVSKLIGLWISEGFVKSCEGKTVEEIAEGYLENLYGRNLVMGAKKSCGGKIKACHIHDLLHDFCKDRAKHLRWIRRDQSGLSSPACYDQFNRLSIYKSYRAGKWSSCPSFVGSIILHDWNLDFYMVSQVIYNFKFLKVLDMELLTIGSLPTDLVFLRYFAAKSGKSLLIAPFITKRWNLETLILDNYFGERVSLPFAALCREMVKLRHLHVPRCRFTVDFVEGLLENHEKLYDLQTLSTPYFSSLEDMELILREMPNLWKLSCQVEPVQDFVNNSFNFPTQIERLKIVCEFKPLVRTIPFLISTPNLKNLTLECFTLHPQHLSGIASLQNLQVLKLKNIWFVEKEWKLSNGEFPQLKILKLDNQSFKVWHVPGDAFPNLERLILHHCWCLKEIPSCFEDSSSLKSIEVKNCKQSLDKSARDIWKTQVEDYDNYSFTIIGLSGK